MRAPRLRALLLPALVLLAGSAAHAQVRVAQLKTVTGKVTIRRAQDGKVDEARQAGPRVQNGSVFGGDVVATDGGATASLVFGDGSQVDLKEKTSLTVQEVDLSALVAAGKSEKPLGRRIKLLAGDVLSKVVPNPQVATEFETPSGVAAVKGTTLTLAVDANGRTLIKTDTGLVTFTTRDGGLVLDLGDGLSATLTPRAGGGFDLVVPESNPGPITLSTVAGTRFSVTPGTAITGTSLTPTMTKLTVNQGSMSGAGVTLGAGRALAYGGLPTGGGTVAVKTEEGSVQLTNQAHGATVSLAEGFGATVGEDAQGKLKIDTPASNPGPLDVLFGDDKVAVAPGSRVAADTTSGLDVAVESGSATVTVDGVTTTLGAGGATGETGTKTTGPGGLQTLQVSCGECAVPDGTGGCLDVDALCATDPCVVDRICRAGQCVGGRRKTSKEDPNCQ